MEGLYLYCLRAKPEGSCAILTKGIDGRGEVFILPFRNLEAIVSEVCLEEFASGEIQQRAQEDLNWIKEKALNHTKVIEEAMREDKGLSLIPMRFGTLFQDKVRLEETLERDYSKIKEVMENVQPDFGVKFAVDVHEWGK